MDTRQPAPFFPQIVCMFTLVITRIGKASTIGYIHRYSDKRTKIVIIKKFFLNNLWKKINAYNIYITYNIFMEKY